MSRVTNRIGRISRISEELKPIANGA